MSLDRWVRPLDEPPRPAPRAMIADLRPIQQKASPFLEVIWADRWIYPWTDPMRRAVPIRQQQDHYAETARFNVVADRWHHPFEIPVWFRAIHAAFQPYRTDLLEAPPFQEQITAARSARPFTDLPPTVKTLPIALHPTTTVDPTGLMARERVLLSEFWPPWDEPVRVRAPLPPSAREFALSFPYVERVRIDGWLSELVPPPRPRSALAVYEQAVLALAEAVFTETTTLDRWGAPLGEPPRPRTGLMAAAHLFAALTRSAPFNEVIWADRWLYPWSEPVRPVRLLPLPAGEVLSNVRSVGTPGWLYPWSEPVRQNLFSIAQQAVSAIGTAPLDRSLLDRWGYAWSDPVRPCPQPLSLQSLLVPAASFLEAITADRFSSVWNEPVRPRSGHALSAEPVGEVATPDLVAPINRIRNNSMQGAVVGTIGAGGALPTNWTLVNNTGCAVAVVSVGQVNGVDVIVINVAGTVNVGSNVAFIFDTNGAIPALSGQTWTLSAYESMDTVANFFQHFYMLVERTVGGGSVQSDFIQPGFPATTLDRKSFTIALSGGATVGAVQPSIKYIWSDGAVINVNITVGWPDLRQAKYPGTPIRTAGAAASAPGSFAESVTTDRWLVPWFEPTCRPVFLYPGLPAIFPAFNIGPGIVPWIYPWFEVPRDRLPLPFGAVPAAVAGSLPAERVTYDRWGYPWTEPVRGRTPLPLGAAPAQAQAFAPPFAALLNVDRWGAALNEPVRTVARLGAGSNLDLALVRAAPFAELIGIDRRLRPLENPIRVFQGVLPSLQLAAALASAAPFAGAVLVDRWGAPLAEPVRPRVLPAAGHPVATDPVGVSRAETILYDKWGYPYADPVRFPLRPLTGLYDPYLGLPLPWSPIRATIWAFAPRLNRVATYSRTSVQAIADLQPPIDAGTEIATSGFDYGDALIGTGLTIRSAVVTASVVRGTDPTPQARVLGLPQIVASKKTGAVGQQVTQSFGNTLGPVTYLITCLATLSDGQVLPLSTHWYSRVPS